MSKFKSKDNILNGASPEIGNPVHIKKLQDHERYEDEMYQWGIEIGHKKVTCTGHFHAYFICAECGNEHACITIETGQVNQSNIDLDDYEANCTCNNCKTEYKFEDGLIKVSKNILHPEKLQKEEEV